MSGRVLTIVDLLRTKVAENPEQVLFASKKNTEKYSFTNLRDFWRGVLETRQFLLSIGVQPGDRIGLMFPVGLAWEQFHFAILACRAVVVGLAPHDTKQALNQIAIDAEIHGILAGSSSELLKFKPEIIENWKFAILLEQDESTNSLSVPIHRWESTSLSNSTMIEEIEELPQGSDLATVIYTSGSTSEPKGIAYNHAQLLLASEEIASVISETQVISGWRTICWLPLANLFQRMMNICALSQGATIYFVADPTEIINEIQQIHPHVFVSVPRFYQKLKAGIDDKISKQPWPMRKLVALALRISLLVKKREIEKRSSSVVLSSLLPLCDVFVLRKLRMAMGNSIQFLYSGSAPLEREIAEFFDAIGVPLVEAYGMSENIVPIAMGQPGKHRHGSVGKVLPSNTVKLSEQQEILISGPGLFSGYFGKERSLDKWSKDGFYISGDYGRFDEDNYLYLQGRRSDIIKTSTGRRVSPLMIESVFNSLTFVEHVIAFGWNRKLLTILVTINESHPALAKFFSDADSISEEWPTEELSKFLSEQFKICASKLGKKDRPGGIIVLRTGFSIHGGELTANLKFRRKAIEEKYGSFINRLYDQIDRYGSEEALLWCVSTEELRQESLRSVPVCREVKFSWAARTTQLISIVSKVSWLLAKDKFARLTGDAYLMKQAHENGAKRIAKIIQEDIGSLKGPIAKVAQMVDFLFEDLPKEIIEAVSSLRSLAPPLHNDLINQVVVSELGAPIEEFFKSWSKDPLGVASMSQLHIAELHSGEKVVVKVQIPNAMKIVKADLLNLRCLSPLLSRLLSIKNCYSLTQELSELILDECNFIKEAERQTRFRDFFSESQDIIVPKVYHELSSEKILTTEYINGKTFEEFVRSSSQEQKNNVAKIIWKAVSYSVNVHGFFNADPHPGNFLFINNKVCFLDFGFCKEWSGNFLKNWQEQTLAGCAGDLERFKQSSIKLGFTSRSGNLDFQHLMNVFTKNFYLAWKDDLNFKFNKDFVRTQVRFLLIEGLGQKNIIIPREFLAISRLFFGLHSLMAELDAHGNWYKDVIPIIEESVARLKVAPTSPSTESA